MSIFTRPCGHSDETTRKTKYPERCRPCGHKLLESRVANAKALNLNKKAIDEEKGISPEREASK